MTFKDQFFSLKITKPGYGISKRIWLEFFLFVLCKYYYFFKVKSNQLKILFSLLPLSCSKAFIHLAQGIISLKKKEEKKILIVIVHVPIYESKRFV